MTERLRVKILLVDDDEAILALLEEVLSGDESFAITTLLDSQAAFRLLEREAFDLVVTDLMMPKVDGLRLLEHAISLNPDVLVVIITGYASLETTLEAIHAGVYDYITKPFRIEEFRLLVDNAAARIRLMRENRTLALENERMRARVAGVEAVLVRQGEEIGLLREELGRREELIVQSGAAGRATNESAHAAGFSSYGKDTAGDRYRRHLQRLEEQFSSGSLTPEEFEVAKQRLKASI
jgi:DNA-binding response OmpR family regulator